MVSFSQSGFSIIICILNMLLLPAPTVYPSESPIRMKPAVLTIKRYAFICWPCSLGLLRIGILLQHLQFDTYQTFGLHREPSGGFCPGPQLRRLLCNTLRPNLRLA